MLAKIAKQYKYCVIIKTIPLRFANGCGAKKKRREKGHTLTRIANKQRNASDKKPNGIEIHSAQRQHPSGAFVCEWMKQWAYNLFHLPNSISVCCRFGPFNFMHPYRLGLLSLCSRCNFFLSGWISMDGPGVPTGARYDAQLVFGSRRCNQNHLCLQMTKGLLKQTSGCFPFDGSLLCGARIFVRISCKLQFINYNECKAAAPHSTHTP